MDGIINVYKEAGYTSFDVVAKLRGILKQKKIGHTGTLDPDAEGALPICLGKATKVCEYLLEKDKVYRAVLRLGVTTDTQDMSGTVVRECSPNLSEERLLELIQTFTGKQMQIPPMYSALKVNGRKLCDLARAGVTVERKAREIEIYSIEALSVDMPCVTIQVHCSKGTYIHALCHDIGESAGCGGCMERLLRIKTGSFSIQDAYKLDEIEAAAKGTHPQGKRLSDLMFPIDSVLGEYPCVTAVKGMEKILSNGGRLLAKQTMGQDGFSPALYRMYNAEGQFAGLFRYDEKKLEFYPQKMFL